MTLAYNGDFALWHDGLPVGWSLTGVGAEVEIGSGAPIGRHVVRLRKNGNDNAHLGQNLQVGVLKTAPSLEWTRGKLLGFACAVKYTQPAGSDVLAHLSISDSHQEIHSDDHPGDGRWHWLMVGQTLDRDAATQAFVNCSTESPSFADDDVTAEFAGATAVLHEAPRDWMPGPTLPAFPVRLGAAPEGILANGAVAYLGGNGMHAQEDFVSLHFSGRYLVTGLNTRAGAPPGDGETFTYTLRVNGADTAMVAIAGGNAQPAGSGESVLIGPASDISVKVEASAGAAQTTHRAMLHLQEVPV